MRAERLRVAFTRLLALAFVIGNVNFVLASVLPGVVIVAAVLR